MAAKQQRRGGPAQAPASGDRAAKGADQGAGLDMSAIRDLMNNPEVQEEMSANALAALTGKFVVQGNWDSFSEWHLQFMSGQLVLSHTDDLSANEWPTTVKSSGRELTLTQRTEGSDATLIEELVVEVVPGTDGSTLRVKTAKSTFVDHSSDGEQSTRAQSGLTVVRA